MREMKNLFREANQMIVGGRLYYSIEKRDFKALEAHGNKSPALKRALREASPVEGHPGSLVLVPADLIKDAEEDMIG